MSLKNLRELISRGVVVSGMCVPAAFDAVSPFHDVPTSLYTSALHLRELDPDPGIVRKYYRDLGLSVGIVDEAGWEKVSSYTLRPLVERKIRTALQKNMRVVGDFIGNHDHMVGLSDLTGGVCTLVGIQLIANPFMYSLKDAVDGSLPGVELSTLIRALCSGGEFYRIM